VIPVGSGWLRGQTPQLNSGEIVSAMSEGGKHFAGDDRPPQPAVFKERDKPGIFKIPD